MHNSNLLISSLFQFLISAWNIVSEHWKFYKIIRMWWDSSTSILIFIKFKIACLKIDYHQIYSF